MKPTKADYALLRLMPRRRWFAAGSIGMHGARVARLARIGLLVRRLAPAQAARTWDYHVEVCGGVYCGYYGADCTCDWMRE